MLANIQILIMGIIRHELLAGEEITLPIPTDVVIFIIDQLNPDEVVPQ